MLRLRHLFEAFIIISDKNMTKLEFFNQ